MSSQRTVAYTTPRPDLAGLVPHDARRLLDIGCANGALGAALKERQGAEVIGIEIDPAFVAEAEERLDRVLSGEALAALESLDGERFDCVICGDVLEHLVDPGAVLRRVHGLVDPHATVVVSLPNVRFYDTLVQVGVRGWWPERDRGVHDRTHLRWFTDRNARAMFAAAGFQVQISAANYRLRDRPDASINRFAHRLARGPARPFLAYQLLYALRPA